MLNSHAHVHRERLEGMEPFEKIHGGWWGRIVTEKAQQVRILSQSVGWVLFRLLRLYTLFSGEQYHGYICLGLLPAEREPFVLARGGPLHVLAVPPGQRVGCSRREAALAGCCAAGSPVETSRSR